MNQPPLRVGELVVVAVVGAGLLFALAALFTWLDRISEINAFRRDYECIEFSTRIRTGEGLCDLYERIGRGAPEYGPNVGGPG